MAPQPPKVFISYSHDSLEHARRVLGLAERLRKDGVDTEIDQYVAGTPTEGWPRWMLDRLDWADFILSVCTETYYRRFRGHEEPNQGKGVDFEGQLITLAIYHAKSRTERFVPVLFEPKDERLIPEPVSGHTHYLLSSEDNYAKLYAFLTGQAGVVPAELGPLKTQVREAVEPLRFGNAEATGELHGVPELPPHYLSRETHLGALKQKLLNGGAKVGIPGQSAAVGVQGMGGIGKTVLATALVHDPEVRKAFPEGIFWLTVGQAPKSDAQGGKAHLLGLQAQLVSQMTGAQPAFVTVQQGKDALRKALVGRRALVVLDDVWTIEDADAFCVDAPPARPLITTRNDEVLVGVGAEHHVDVLLLSDALKMLAGWAGEKDPDKLPPEASEVAKECGCLPLALAMVGAMVRLRPTGWNDALTRLKRADLVAIKRAFPGYPYPNLLRAIEVSVKALEESDQERYLDLAVFPQDQPIPERTLGVLWKLDDVDTHDCMARFVTGSLATWATDEAGKLALRLHDLQRDLIRKRREKKLPSLHLRLVKAWDALAKPPDPYAWRWIGYHLIQAGRKDDLRRLLLNFNWLQAKLEATDVNALIADYDYLPQEPDLRNVQSVLRQSAHILAGNPRELPGQLLGRLHGNLSLDIDGLRIQASEHKGFPWLRPLKPSLPSDASLVRTLQGHTHLVSAVAITPDGRRAVSGSDDSTLRVWDLETGQTLTTLQGHTLGVSAVAITPDGRRAVFGSGDTTLRVWDLETGQTLTTLQGHTHWVNAVAITPDGRCALSGSEDSTLRVWDLRDGKELVILTVDRNVTVCAVAHDNRTIVAGDGFGRVHFLRLVEPDPTKPAPEDIKIQLLRREKPAN